MAFLAAPSFHDSNGSAAGAGCDAGAGGAVVELLPPPHAKVNAMSSRIDESLFQEERVSVMIPGDRGRRAASIPAAPSTQWLLLLAMSDIFAMASSMVKVLGFCIAGKSLKVSANFAAAACASMMK